MEGGAAIYVARVVALPLAVQAALGAAYTAHPESIPDDESAGDQSATLGADFHHWYGLTQLWLVSQGLPQLQRGRPTAAVDAAVLAPAAALPSDGARPPAAAAVAAPVALAARSALVDICRSRLPQAVYFLQRAIAGIQPAGDAAAVTASISVADALIGCLPADQRGPLLLRLAHSYGLPGVLTEELRAFKAAAAPASGGAVAASFVSDLNTRLAFYGQFLRESALELTEGDVTALWGAFVDGATSSDEPEAFFAWLSHCCGNNDAARYTLPGNACVGVFLNLFCNPARFRTASAGIHAYKCFEEFFRLASETTGALLRANEERWAVSSESLRLVRDEAGTGEGRVLLDLAGLDVLWEVTLHAQSPGVAAAALDFLLALHTRIDQPAEGPGAEWDADGLIQSATALRTRVWLGFVERCMESLRAAATAPASSRGVVTVLRVLSRFLEGVEETAPASDADRKKFGLEKGVVIIPFEGPPAPPPFGKIAGLIGFVREPGSKDPQRVNVSLRPALETIGMLRSRLAEVFDCPSQCLRLQQTCSSGNGVGAVLSAETADDVYLGAATGLRVTFDAYVLSEPADDTRAHVYVPYEERIRKQVGMRAVACTAPGATPTTPLC